MKDVMFFELRHWTYEVWSKDWAPVNVAQISKGDLIRVRDSNGNLWDGGSVWKVIAHPEWEGHWKIAAVPHEKTQPEFPWSIISVIMGMIMFFTIVPMALSSNNVIFSTIGLLAGCLFFVYLGYLEIKGKD